MAQAGVRGEGLRWPSAGFRREPVVFFRRPFAFPGMCHPEPGRLSLANGGEGSALRSLRLSAVSGANVVANGGEGSAFPFSRHSFTLFTPSFEGSLEGPGSSFSLATRHSPLLLYRMAAPSQNSPLQIDGQPCGRRPAEYSLRLFSFLSDSRGQR